MLLYTRKTKQDVTGVSLVQINQTNTCTYRVQRNIIQANKLLFCCCRAYQCIEYTPKNKNVNKIVNRAMSWIIRWVPTQNNAIIDSTLKHLYALYWKMYNNYYWRVTYFFLYNVHYYNM